MDDPHADFVSCFCAPHLRLHFRGVERTSFTHPSESYAEWSLLACEAGAFRFCVGEHAGTAGPLDCVLCPPRTVFERHVEGGLLTFHFARFEWSVDAERCPIVGLSRPRDAARARANLNAWSEAEGREGALARAWREHILADVLRSALWSASQPPSRPDDALMQRARAALDERAAQSVSMAALARELGLSPVALSRRFRAAHGELPSEYLARRRLEEARRLLLGTDWTLDRIAGACGMANGFYFSRVWAKRFGQSPGQFRRERRV